MAYTGFEDCLCFFFKAMMKKVLVRNVLAVLSKPFDETTNPFKEPTVTIGDLLEYMQVCYDVIVAELESHATMDFWLTLFQRDKAEFKKNFDALRESDDSRGVCLSNFNMARLALVHRICEMPVEIPVDESSDVAPDVSNVSRCLALCFALHYFVLLMKELLSKIGKKQHVHSLFDTVEIDCSIKHLRRGEVTRRKRDRED